MLLLLLLFCDNIFFNDSFSSVFNNNCDCTEANSFNIDAIDTLGSFPESFALLLLLLLLDDLDLVLLLLLFLLFKVKFLDGVEKVEIPSNFISKSSDIAAL